MNKLPEAIEGYIAAANAHSPENLAACFDPDGTVLDEGKVRYGRHEIEAWAAETAARYQTMIEPIELVEADGKHRLQAIVRGQFPGSPLKLYFNFVLQSERIQSLEITS